MPVFVTTIRVKWRNDVWNIQMWFDDKNILVRRSRTCRTLACTLKRYIVSVRFTAANRVDAVRTIVKLYRHAAVTTDNPVSSVKNKPILILFLVLVLDGINRVNKCNTYKTLQYYLKWVLTTAAACLSRIDLRTEQRRRCQYYIFHCGTTTISKCARQRHTRPCNDVNTHLSCVLIYNIIIQPLPIMVSTAIETHFEWTRCHRCHRHIPVNSLIIYRDKDF